MALLFNEQRLGGSGVEYNEPRGHANMVRDQLTIDPSRWKPVALVLPVRPLCPQLVKELGGGLFFEALQGDSGPDTR